MTRDRLAAFDVETTGVDPETDRIVSAAFVIVDRDGTVAHSDEWIIDPGVDIPAAATAVHGISTAQARQRGTNAPSTLLDIAKSVAGVLAAGMPLVVFNAAFDLTMLDRELRRHQGLPFHTGNNPRPIVDPFVLDKAVDRYRPGKRTLTAVCDQWNIPLTDAHDATADAVAAARLAFALLDHSSLRYIEPDDLHTHQVEWRRQQCDSLAAHFTAEQGRLVEIDGRWPLIPKD